MRKIVDMLRCQTGSTNGARIRAATGKRRPKRCDADLNVVCWDLVCDAETHA